MAILGKLLGVDQDKAVGALSEEVKQLFGGMTLDQWFEKYGDTHQLGFSVSVVNSEVKGKVWLEDKEKSSGTIPA